MRTTFSRSIGRLIASALVLAVCSAANAERVVIFGDSLSDTGNQHFATGMVSVPPYDTLDAFLIPDAPYAHGGIHFSDGRLWIEHVAAALGSGGSARPALASEGAAANYAWGGARASGPRDNDFPAQIARYLADVNHDASDEDLYVIFIGGNDVRDALIAGMTNPVAAVVRLGEALSAVSDGVNALYVAGARRFLFLNAPNVGIVPALAAFPPSARDAGTCLSLMFNLGTDAPPVCPANPLPGLDDLAAGLQSAGAEVKTVDVFSFITGIATYPAVFGLTNVTDACVTPNVAPFMCDDPSKYLFVDGIHPTKVVHRMLGAHVVNVLDN